MQLSPIPIQQILSILYVLHNLEYKNGDCHSRHNSLLTHPNCFEGT